MGKLAKPPAAAVQAVSRMVAGPSPSLIEGALGEALRENFGPIVDEPIPDRIREMIDKIRIEEQQQRGRKL